MNWLRQMFSRRQRYEELSEEIREHLDERVEELVASGMSTGEATHAASREFGNVTLVQQDSREVWRWSSIEDALTDLRYAARTLRANPGFTAVALLTLSLGLGANSAIFQLLDAVRLRSLPVQDPQQLAEVHIVGGNHGMGLNQDYGELTRPLWREIRNKQHAFSAMFAWNVNQRYLGQGSQMRRFNGLWVSGDFFNVLGVRPWRGRLLMPQDEHACPVSQVVVSHSYWQSELGGRDLGTGIKLVANNDLVEVVGVAPPQFLGMVVGQNFDIALPFCHSDEELRRDVFEVSVMGRLKPGWTMQRASADLNALSPGIFEATIPPGHDPRNVNTYKKFTLAARPAGSGVSSFREKYDTPLRLLLGITGLVLLIACANLANLMLAKASARQREMAVRLALGASRSRLVRQLLTESVLLATMGTALGIAVAKFLSRVLVSSVSPAGSPVILPTELDWRVLLFMTSAAVLTCVIFGVIPALRAVHVAPVSAMKAGGGRTTVGREQFLWQRLLVVAQLSVSLVLLVGALLFVRSFRNLMNLDPGMRQDGITVAFLGFWQSNLAPARWADRGRELLDEVRSVPGVVNAASTTRVPLVGGSWEHGIRVGSIEDSSKFTWVSPGYFATMAIPMLRGRGFSDTDLASSPRVAVVNEMFVKRFLPDTDPIGKTLRTVAEPGYPATSYEIVGIISDTRYDDPRATPPPMAFAPVSQCPGAAPFIHLMIHSQSGPPTINAVKRMISARHRDVLMEFSDFQQQIHDGLIAERLMAMLAGFFGLLAALLATIGLYGVISYIVQMRWNEIGIRMALGASRSEVLRNILRDTALLLAIGMTFGTGLALIVTRSAATLLYGLQSNDALTFGAAGAILAAAALFACYVPALRASRLDPMVALRYE